MVISVVLETSGFTVRLSVANESHPAQMKALQFENLQVKSKTIPRIWKKVITDGDVSCA